MGAWLAVHGESIYGADAGPVQKLPWGRSTAKPGILYLHVYDWPKGELAVPGITAKVSDAYVLGDPERTPLLIGRNEDGVMTVGVPRKAPDHCVNVIVLEIEGGVRQAAVGKPTAQAADGTIRLHAANAAVHGTGARYESGGGKDNIGYWSNPADWVSWKFDVKKPGRFSVSITYACARGTGGSEYAVGVGGQKIMGTIRETGSWTTFVSEKIGELAITKAGAYTLSVKPTKKPGSAVMNLQAITLEPAGK